jgi:hypothetical protein
MKRFAVLLLVWPLAGCFEDQQKQVATCELAAIKTYPDEQLVVGGHVEHYIISCMAAHGYNWDIHHKRCDVTNAMAKNPYCYVPSGKLAQLVYSLEIGGGAN